MLLQPLVSWCIKMSGKTLINVEKPQTQTVDAIKALLSWRGRASDPLPSFLEMGEGDNRLVLVLSNKKDCYYTVTGKDCSCPAHNWHPGQRCKHQRKHFAEYAAPKAAPKPAGADLIPRQQFRPFLEDETQPARRLAMPPEETAKAAASSSFAMVDTTPDANPREIAYWSIAEDKTMWPAEA